MCLHSQSPIAPRRISFVIALLCVIALGLEFSGLDLVVMDALYRAGGNEYVLRNDWWAKIVLHDAGQATIKFIAVGALLISVFGKWLPVMQPWRRAAFYLFLFISLSSLLVAFGKSTSNISCPWDLSRYGGDRPYVLLYQARPAHLRAARCFPSGHASGGFSLLALFFIACAFSWRRPVVYLLPGVVVGLLFAATQWLRGAHFPSHDVWTAAMCLALSWLLYRYGFRQRLCAAQAKHRANGAGLSSQRIAPQLN